MEGQYCETVTAASAPVLGQTFSVKKKYKIRVPARRAGGKFRLH